MTSRRPDELPLGPKRLVVLVALALALASPRGAAAQTPPPPPRDATFEWNQAKTELAISVNFRDAVDPTIRKKLSRGLPTTIVLTGTLFRKGQDKPISTTVQTCKVTWHVWNEAYQLQITRPEGSRTRWTTTLEGVLRRCAQANRLLVATREQVELGVSVRLTARVLVNPVSPAILRKIKRWVNRPSRTGTAAPGDALFSTFTGLFMQRIGEAERVVEFSTRSLVPGVRVRSKRRRHEG